MEFRIEKALEADYREMAGLIQKVWDSLANKEWFAADNAEYTYGILAAVSYTHLTLPTN